MYRSLLSVLLVWFAWLVPAAYAAPAPAEPDEAEGDAEAEPGDEPEDEPDTAAEQPEAAAAAAEPPTGARADATAAVGAGADVRRPRGDADEDAEAAEDESLSVELSGYLNPGFGVKYRPQALPRDELDYGFFGSVGLIVVARPFEMWKGTAHVLFGAQTVSVVTDIEPYDPSGASGGLWMTKKELWQTLIEEATVAFEPGEWFGVKVGAMRIPFTLQQQSANTALLFPTRSGPNECFLSGADLGGLLQSNVGSGILTTSIGVFNGDSLGLLFEDTVARGVVLSFRGDVNPLGAFPFDEGDWNRGPFRLGLGFGVLWRPATWYDEQTGFEVASMDDVRMSASLRLAAAGFYFGAEYLRRQQIDDFSSRPQVADGAYGQLSYYVPIADVVALEPIARVGVAVKDEAFDPRTIGWMDVGLSFYPRADVKRPDRVKLTLQYIGEKRFTEGAEAHGGQTAVRFLF